MKRYAVLLLAPVLVSSAGGCQSGESPDALPNAPTVQTAAPRAEGPDSREVEPVQQIPIPQGPHGTIRGRIGLDGRSPGNIVIRMGVDPKCGELNRDRMVVQEAIAANAEGDLANVFVWVAGDFPPVRVPATPVRIDQRNCIYSPRVVGARVGQTVEIRNSDDLLHNVHASSGAGNSFNVSQGRAGLVYEFVPVAAEIMVHLGCDLHRWMTAFVGVVDHPYFAVTGADGTYRIDGVPVGTYEVRTWHEEYGTLRNPVTVAEDAESVADLSYRADP